MARLVVGFTIELWGAGSRRGLLITVLRLWFSPRLLSPTDVQHSSASPLALSRTKSAPTLHLCSLCVLSSWHVLFVTLLVPAALYLSWRETYSMTFSCNCLGHRVLRSLFFMYHFTGSDALGLQLRMFNERVPSLMLSGRIQDEAVTQRALKWLSRATLSLSKL